MKRSFLLLSLAAITSMPCIAATSGKATDRAGRALSGVNVAFVVSGTSTTTDAKGAWSIAGTGIGTRTLSKPLARWTGNAVELTLSSPSRVSIEAYDPRGASMGRRSDLLMGAGPQRIPMSLDRSRTTWLQVTVNGQTTRLQVALGGSLSTPPAQPATRAQAFLDTLQFTWKSKIVAKIPLQTVDTSGIAIAIDTSTRYAWNDSIKYGSLYDGRDGQVYRTVQIGTQIWMAENLNFKASGEVTKQCHGDDTTNCDLYYTWSQAMQGSSSSASIPSGARGICPSNWHVPSDSEWTTMSEYVISDKRVGSDKEGKALRSTSKWGGTDLFGFRALPLGYISSGAYVNEGIETNFWTATQTSDTYAWTRYLLDYHDYLDRSGSRKSYGISLRCVKD